MARIVCWSVVIIVLIAAPFCREGVASGQVQNPENGPLSLVVRQ
jgi:hypothetical protein